MILVAQSTCGHWRNTVTGPAFTRFPRRRRSARSRPEKSLRTRWVNTSPVTLFASELEQRGLRRLQSKPWRYRLHAVRSEGSGRDHDASANRLHSISMISRTMRAMKKVPSTRDVSFARATGFAIVAAVIGLVGCSPESSDAQPSAAKMHVQNEADLTRIIVDYVRHTRGWPDNSFTVQLNSRDGKLLVFWVLHKGDNLHTPGGGGKSFEALLNPDTKRVERELRFQ